MIVFPAIDIKGGVCVRLYQGDYATAHKVAEDPLTTARSFFRAGARWVHLVDLDGAKEKRPVSSAVFLKIAEQSGLMTEVGGGIRTMETVDFYLSHGISRVILGSAALRITREIPWRSRICPAGGEKVRRKNCRRHRRARRKGRFGRLDEGV